MLIRKYAVTLSVLSVLVAISPVSVADDLDVLMERLSGLDTLRGDYRQSTLDGSESTIQSVRGEFQLARPDRLYWYTNPPYEQAIYVDDDVIWIYDADLEQATQQPVTDQWEQSPALVLTGTRDQITERYQVALTTSRGDSRSFELVPRTGGGSIESLTLSFNGKTPVGIRLIDSFNQTTVVNFENLELNADLDDARFEFEPPEGVDVLRQMAP
ncbi:MAG: outer membrane lipoprotein chaperone LolA [Natronospirillum sp.]